jgi:hypothetical protein
MGDRRSASNPRRRSLIAPVLVCVILAGSAGFLVPHGDRSGWAGSNRESSTDAGFPGTSAPGIRTFAVPEVSGVTISPSPAPIDSGQTVTLTAMPTGATGKASFQWYQGNSTSCASNTALTGATNASYTPAPPIVAADYCVVAQDSTGVAASSTLDAVSVNPGLGMPTLVASARSIDAGQPETFTASWSGGTPAYTVKLYSSATSSCSATSTLSGSVTAVGAATSATFPAVFPTTNGSFCAVLADGAVGTPAQSTTSSPAVAVTVVPALSVSTPVPSPRSSADVGQSVAFTSSSSGGSGSDTFGWSGAPTGCPGSTTSVLACADTTVAGTYSVTITAQDSNRFSTTSAPLAFTVDPDPTVGAPTLPSGTIALKTQTTLTAAASGGSGGFTYAWQGVPLGCPSTGASITCTPRIAGTFAISVVATDSNGFSTTSPESFLVVSPALSVFVTSASFAGTTGSFSAIALGGNGTVSYAWAFGDGAAATGATVSHVFPSSGHYTVEVWANDSSGGSASSTWTAMVPAVPASTPTLAGLPEAAVPGVVALAGVAAIGGGLLVQQLQRRRPSGSPGSARAPSGENPQPSEVPELPENDEEEEERESEQEAYVVRRRRKNAHGAVMDSKHLSDYAARSQAVDSAVRPSSGGAGTGVGPIAGGTLTGATSGGAHKGYGIADSKNISDGAAKGQAQERALGSGSSGGGSPGVADTHNLADGAAKGQADDRTASPGEGGSGAPTRSSSDSSYGMTASGGSKGYGIATPGSGPGGSPGGGPAIQDSKNIADGAAKGQAQERTLGSGGSSGGGPGGSRGIEDSKNISDGAAKGQAADLTAGRTPSGSGGTSPGMTDTHNGADGAAKGQADDRMAGPGKGRSGPGSSPGGTPGIQDSKNIADGAAKGQAQERAVGSVGPSGGGSAGTSDIQDSKNISDGAAKGQAQERALGAGGSSGGSSPSPTPEGATAGASTNQSGSYLRRKMPGRTSEVEGSSGSTSGTPSATGHYLRKKMPSKMSEGATGDKGVPDSGAEPPGDEPTG